MKMIKKSIWFCLFVVIFPFISYAGFSKLKNIEGSSMGKYAKPGAPIEIVYSSQKVLAGELSNINIDLLPQVNMGKMDVEIRLGKGLDEISASKKKFIFDLEKERESYNFNLNVVSAVDGLYYIRVMVTIEGKGMRVFAVPVYIGEVTSKRADQPFQKTEKGTDIVVFPANETIIK